MTKDQLKNNVVANFRFVRKQFAMNQLEFSAQVDIPYKTIGAIEEGRAIGVHHVYKLSKLISVSMDTLYTTELSNQNQ